MDLKHTKRIASPSAITLATSWPPDSNGGDLFAKVGIDEMREKNGKKWEMK